MKLAAVIHSHAELLESRSQRVLMVSICVCKMRPNPLLCYSAAYRVHTASGTYEAFSVASSSLRHLETHGDVFSPRDTLESCHSTANTRYIAGQWINA